MITPLATALAERGYDSLTPVQEAVTAADIAGEDLLVSAQTGSGKTVGFGLAIAPTLLEEAEQFGPAGAPLALVVAPTRELAFQVMQELRWLYGQTGALVNACVGGMDVRQERRLLERGTHILVGTPGRLCDHIRRGALDLSAARAVVLDEADEMLDLGFREDLEFILEAAPEERRTLLFSATVSPVIAKLAQQFQRNARRINTINKAQQHSDITYQALRVGPRDSDHAIFNLLRFHEDEGAIVFANTRAEVAHLTTRLANRGIAAVSLSGELSQQERSHALQAMRDGRARVCVATDVAARGIDLPNLNLVIHADLPTNTESLLHRSGRTGRAGRKGISALIVPPKAGKKAERLLKWAKISAEWGLPPSAEDIQRKDQEKLLNDPAWGEPVPEEQAAFAQTLLERFGPEAVAAAVLRLYQDRHGAPEELEVPEAPRERAPREPREARPPREFGPSRWFALSVGRKDRAEPRWLLPMILGASDLEKSAIGAIRVQEEQTYVEIAEAQAAGFEAALGEGRTLEDGVTVEALAEAPDLSRGPKPGGRPEGKYGGKPGGKYGAKPAGKYGDKPGGKYGDKPGGKWGDKPARRDGPRPERGDGPRGEAAKYDRPKRSPKPEGERFERPARDGGPAPRKAKWEPDMAQEADPRADKRKGKKFEGKKFDGAGRGPKRDGKPDAKPRGPAAKGGKWSDPSFGRSSAAKGKGPGGGKPAGKPRGKGPAPQGGNAMPRRSPR